MCTCEQKGSLGPTGLDSDLSETRTYISYLPLKHRDPQNSRSSNKEIVHEAKPMGGRGEIEREKKNQALIIFFSSLESNYTGSQITCELFQLNEKINSIFTLSYLGRCSDMCTLTQKKIIITDMLNLMPSHFQALSQTHQGLESQNYKMSTIRIS